MSIASIGVLISCLLLTGVAEMLSINVSYTMDQIGGTNVTRVFFDEGIEYRDAVYIIENIDKIPNVTKTVFIDKDEAIKGALDYWSQYKQAASTGDGSETISGTAQDALAEWQAENGSAYSPDLMRAFVAGRGYNEEVINQVIGAQKDIAKGELMDAFASVVERV